MSIQDSLLRLASFASFACAMFAAMLPAALAQEGAVRVIVPAPPGGSLDASARLVAKKLAEITGTPHAIENRPGANSQIAAELVLNSAPDGRTLLFTPPGLHLMPLMQKVPFSMDELAPVIQLSVERYLLVVRPDFELQSARDFDAVAARRPKGISCAGPPGTSMVACEQLRVRSGDRVVAARFPGLAPALTALFGGHVDVLFTPAEGATSMIAAGKLKALARTGDVAGMEQVPLASAVWPGLVLDGMNGVQVSAKTPDAVVRRLNRDLNRVLADPEVIAIMREGSQEVVGGAPDRYGEALKQSFQRYVEVFRKIGPMTN